MHTLEVRPKRRRRTTEGEIAARWRVGTTLLGLSCIFFALLFHTYQLARSERNRSHLAAMLAADNSIRQQEAEYLERMRASFERMEDANRHYLLTGLAADRQPYFAQRTTFSNSLRDLTASPATQAERKRGLEAVARKVNAWSALTNDLAEERKVRPRSAVDQHKLARSIALHAEIMLDMANLRDQFRSASSPGVAAGQNS